MLLTSALFKQQLRKTAVVVFVRKYLRVFVQQKVVWNFLLLITNSCAPTLCTWWIKVELAKQAEKESCLLENVLNNQRQWNLKKKKGKHSKTKFKTDFLCYLIFFVLTEQKKIWLRCGKMYLDFNTQQNNWSSGRCWILLKALSILFIYWLFKYSLIYLLLIERMY